MGGKAQNLEDGCLYSFPIKGQLSNLYINISDFPGIGKFYKFTVRKNKTSSTSFIITISDNR